jgi:myotubularin-related protein 1/2
MKVVKNQSAPRHSEKTPSQRFLQVIGTPFEVFVLLFLNIFYQLLFFCGIYNRFVVCLWKIELWDIFDICTGDDVTFISL